MKFLADESCDFAVVRTLRDAGYEVLAVADVSPSASDDAVIALAAQENRILFTEDKDFGQLVFAEQQNSGGVILVRFPATGPCKLANSHSAACHTSKRPLGRPVYRPATWPRENSANAMSA